MASLLDDLACQQERLGQLSADLNLALSACQVTVGQARGLLSHRVGESTPSPRSRPASPRNSSARCFEVSDVLALEDRERPVQPHSKAQSPGNPLILLPEAQGDRDLPLEVTDEVLIPSNWQRKVALSSEPRDMHLGKSQQGSERAPDSVLAGHHLSAGQLLMGRHPSSAKAAEAINSEVEKLAVSHPHGPAHHNNSMGLGGHSMGLSGLNEEMKVWRRNAIFRLQARLGKTTLRGLVSAEEVHRAVTSLGLARYSLEDMEQWLDKVAESREAFHGHEELKPSTGSVRHLNKVIRHRPGSKRSMSKRGPNNSLDSDEDLVPISDGDGSEVVVKKSLSVKCKTIDFKAFVETILDDEILSLMELEAQQMSLTIREVLFSGDANRLVAELTHVRVDDVAAPMDKPDLMAYMEPVVGFMIILNGLFIGAQTDEDKTQNGPGLWFWGNAGFTIFFCGEILIRLHKTGCTGFCKGPEKWWNVFDLFLILISLFDLVVEAASVGAEIAPLSVMRIMRLTRLTRLVRIFRLRYMKELSLMVRGLVGGLKTLFWAVVLLFFTLYVIAILATTTIGRSDEPVPEVARDGLFASVPVAVFTSFRCFLGDCNTSEGKPIIKLLADRYGPIFILAYGVSMIFVTFGLFNLIVAIYIENTLNAAKTEGEKSKVQRQRESVRIARLTRQLLKKFCAVQRLWRENFGEATNTQVKKVMNAAIFDDVGEISMPVSKEMFLCIIQDASVQKLMDDLDIPPERASLFDIFDADGSGGLEVVELITGLLRVRGEAKKSDVVGTLLAVRVVQDMLREQGERVQQMSTKLDGLSRAVDERPFLTHEPSQRLR